MHMSSSILVQMKHGHIAMRRIERDGVDTRPAHGERIAPVAGDLARKGHQCPFHRITFDPPCPVGRAQNGIVAKTGRTGELEQHGMFMRIRIGLVPADSTSRCIPVTVDAIDVAGCDQVCHHHFISGQCARLVRADHRYRAERFDCRQTAHDCVSPGHGLHPDGKRDCHHGRQAFGNGGNRKPDNDHEEFGKGQMTDHQPVGEQQCRNDQDEERQPARENIHLPHERRRHPMRWRADWVR